MVARIEAFLRRIRRYLSRSEWAIRLLRLSHTTESAVAPGLVMIQIDGLSHRQLTRAIANGNMPFMKKLLDDEHYRLHHLYSGLPSSTPAIQGELFYGVKNAVPAFSFFDRASGELHRMYEPVSAATVEDELSRRGAPLMTGGSVYADIFTGGAMESHFCPAALGWGQILRAANPFVLGFLVLTHLYSAVRIGVLVLLEFVLAIIDGIRGVSLGYRFAYELKFVATRVAICILLRELVTIGTKIDVARGLPIIHLNLLGYDEQAHRRGPESRFAHWALKGIDDSVARIWRAAHAATRREYDVWIYADHGQEHTEPYEKAFGQPVEEAIAAVFQEFEGGDHSISAQASDGIQAQRIRFLGGGHKIRRLFPAPPVGTPQPVEGIQAAPDPSLSRVEGEHLHVVAMGPIGLIYYSRGLDEAAFAALARGLVDSARLPIVLRKLSDQTIRAWTARGEFDLPQQAAEVLGPDHPFLTEAAADLVALCCHPNAGDLVFSGWRYDAKPYTFPIENGSHAGPGAEETDAFALLPDDTVLPQRPVSYLRPSCLRGAAQHLLGRETLADVAAIRRRRAEAGALRVMTYNVHSCIGMDGKLSPERIARVIARYDVDVVCLQELDVGRMRTDGVDQAHAIAQWLEMDFHFYPTIHVEEEKYGDAILTPLPLRYIKADKLPTLAHKPGLESRGALSVAVEFNGKEIQIINTHLGLLPSERALQVDALTSSQWLRHPDRPERVVLCGDFNALPSSSVCRALNGYLNDAQIELQNHRPRKTFFGRYPMARIDHIYLSNHFTVRAAVVGNSKLAQVASDHRPLIVEIELQP